MADMTDRNSVICQGLVDLLKANWNDIGFASEKDVYYGDQPLYPRFPASSVEAAPQERVLNQTGLQQRIGFTMYIMLHHGGIKTASARQKENDELSEAVLDVLHANRQLGGLVIHGLETRVEPGFLAKPSGLLVTHRITWEGISNFTVPRT